MAWRSDVRSTVVNVVLENKLEVAIGMESRKSDEAYTHVVIHSYTRGSGVTAVASTYSQCKAISFSFFVCLVAAAAACLLCIGDNNKNARGIAKVNLR